MDNIPEIQNKLYKPSDIAALLCDIPKNTLQHYLRDQEMFPPHKIDENGYRYYSKEIIHQVFLYKKLMKDPYRYKTREIKSIFQHDKIEHLINLYLKSPRVLFDFLRKKYDITNF